MNAPKSFFDYTNYRDLLKSLIDDRKTEGKTFSYRWFSQKAGYSSPNFLKLILEGKRNLTNDGIERISQVFQFDKKEKTFFRILVHLNQTKDEQQREALLKDLFHFLGQAHPVAALLNNYNYYAKWYFIAIRELIGAGGGGLSAEGMAQRIQPNLSVNQVQEALDALVALQMIIKRDTGYVVTDKMISTGDEITALAVTQYHLNMLRLAGESISRFSKEEREISCVTLSLTPEKATEAKKMIQEFRKQLWALETEDPHKEVYQINFQLFPMTSSKKGVRHR